MNDQEVILQIILHGGNARSSAMEAIASAKHGDAAAAKNKLEEAIQELNQAHKIQTQLIQQEAAGETVEMGLLMVHAQDHLMNAITIKDLAQEFVDMYLIINKNG